MAFAPGNPNGICVGMDISVGAFQTEEKKDGKKNFKIDGISLGEAEYFHGILPQWKFLEEKYFEKWDKNQKLYKGRLQEIRMKRLKAEAELSKYAHNELLCFTGPEWYQELAPQQKEIINNLKTVVKKDLETHLTKATRSSLSLLGMTPLPNDNQLWRAITKSYGCPVEFLLVLYQLIEPHRKFYSINDRLLLSGVAHLCLRDTLKEMHVRSPSPPRKGKKSPAPKPKPKKKKFASVYLIPFSFQWPQRRSDVYRNPVIQRPTCPYFSYICGYKSVSLQTFEDLHQTERVDENIKIPCELFDDHLVAEEYYNSLFKRSDSAKYILLRPKIYESTTPKTYPGVLPKFMLTKKYPPPIKLILEVKIYDEINNKNQKMRKVIRTICEVRRKPEGRPGQSSAANLIAKYVYLRNIDEYVKEIRDDTIDEDLSAKIRDYPCSICGGPDKKVILPELKPIKERSWIKRPTAEKKKREIIYTNLSDYMETGKEEVMAIDEETRKIIAENKKYMETWNAFFEKLAHLQKLRLDTETCACPEKTKDESRFNPDIDCTCAIWNIPTPPKPIPPEISCECDPKLEDEYIPVPSKPDKCDCKQKAREQALEKCKSCGKPTAKTEKELAQRGVCECTRILDACGNCVRQAPMKFPLIEGENQNECECYSKPPEEGHEVTVAYVFMDNNPTENNEKDCCCRHSKYFYLDRVCSCEEKKKAKMKKKEQKKDERNRIGNDKKISVISDKKKKKNKNAERVEKIEESKEEASKTDIKYLLERGKILQLDHCRRETEELLNLLKCCCPKCKDLRMKYRSRYIQAGTRDGCGGFIPVIGGAISKNEECECLEKFEKRVEDIKEYKQRLKAKVELKSQPHNYVISGVKQTHTGPIYNISSVIPTQPCICKTTEQIAAEMKKGEELTTTLEPRFKHVISGVKGGSGRHEFIISEATKVCECSQLYEKFMKEHNECLVNYERYLNYMSRDIHAYMKDINERYKDPPLIDQKLIETEMKRMTGAPGLPLPEGKSQVLISGVQATQLGMTFIIGSRLLDRTEECTITAESYAQIPDKKESNMTKCQRTFICNYMTFGRNCANPFQPTKEVKINKSSEEIICRCISYESLEGETSEESVEEKEPLDRCACECPCGVEIQKPDDCSCPVREESEDSCICVELKTAEEKEEDEIRAPEGCNCGFDIPETLGTISDPCLCGFKNCGCQVDSVCVKECFYGPMEAWWSKTDFKEAVQKDIREETPTDEGSGDLVLPFGGASKRYVILRKLPKKPKEQRDFIEKLLKGLADDGYPLARLPDVHRLPYFWLWMQLRLRKRWNYDDAVRNYRRSQILWKHVEVCRRKVPYPKLPVYCVCEASNYTWREANTVSRIVNQTKNKFYNKVRNNLVNYAREFYATLSAYQYPNPPYLSHYFYAYQPGKVENVLARYVWEGHEHKNPRDYKSCLCK